MSKAQLPAAAWAKLCLLPTAKNLRDETEFEQDLLFWGRDYKVLLVGFKKEPNSCWAHFTSLFLAKSKSLLRQHLSALSLDNFT